MNSHLSSESSAIALELQDEFSQLRDESDAFNETFALKLFRFQAVYLPVYAAYLNALKINPESILAVESIPHLPISFFKNHPIQCWPFEAATVFTSSGTTGEQTSKHALPSVDFYDSHTLRLFEKSYGNISNWVILALLPSYLERTGSSLVRMTQTLISRSGNPESGFFLYDTNALIKSYEAAKSKGKRVLLLGVSYALLDFGEKGGMALQPEDVLMETGGMKGRRKEMIRQELHEMLAHAFGCQSVHSEYGMTELLSQAYSSGQGLYELPFSMSVRIRDINDPFSQLSPNQTGGIDIIDLANIHSCAFIQTQDLGKKIGPRTFEVLGRFDHSDLRGCNLLI